jgi:hypothetical protein
LSATSRRPIHRDVVALDAGRLATLACLGHDDADAALRQVGGQRQADRAAADDQHLRFDVLGHVAFQKGDRVGWP